MEDNISGINASQVNILRVERHLDQEVARSVNGIEQNIERRVETAVNETDRPIIQEHPDSCSV